MKKRGKPAKDPETIYPGARRDWWPPEWEPRSRFPQAEQQNSFPAANSRVRPTANKLPHFPKLHPTDSLTATPCRLSLVRNGVTGTELQVGLTPHGPATGPAPDSMTSFSSGRLPRLHTTSYLTSAVPPRDLPLEPQPPADRMPKEPSRSKRLKTGLCIKTEEARQLQLRYNNLTEEKDQLEILNNDLIRENKQLQSRNTTLSAEKSLLETNISALAGERDELKYRLWKIASRRIKDGWIRRNTSLYKISVEKKSWNESRQICLKMGADLVIVNDEDEQHFIASYKNHWIGLSDTEEEGVWRWVDGTVLTNPYWAPGEPNDVDDTDKKGSEDCAEISSDATDFSKAWNDMPCSTAFQYICEDHF
ncbi:C-type lectin domain family 4 member F-like [Sardina pilchardus]|uniref:C-type lectin domain family 4 member F-like n=1 Tax=Sardina pilchardus TaxID=27697 RepID=UPI002E0E0DE1